MKIYKRFKCKICGYLSPGVGGYKITECNCPTCKLPMTMGYYRQHKNHCTLIKEA